MFDNHVYLVLKCNACRRDKIVLNAIIKHPQYFMFFVAEIKILRFFVL